MVITPGTPVTINSVEGFQLRRCDRRARSPAAVPGSSRCLRAVPGQLLHRDDRLGRPVARPAAGTITQDASNPSVYYITGTHTFLDTGTFTVTQHGRLRGRPITVPVNGVPITINSRPRGTDPRNRRHRHCDARDRWPSRPSRSSGPRASPSRQARSPRSSTPAGPIRRRLHGDISIINSAGSSLRPVPAPASPRTRMPPSSP